MSSNKSRLGRGLGGLIAGAGSAAPKAKPATPATSPKKDTVAKKTTAAAGKPAAQKNAAPNDGAKIKNLLR